MMRTTSIVAATAFASLMLVAASAFAGEGNGDPFPFHVQFAPVAIGPTVADVGSAGYPAANQAYATTGLAQQTVPAYGSEGAVESANSLPRNFAVGTVQYANAESANRYFAQQADRHYAQLRAQAQPRG